MRKRLCKNYLFYEHYPDSPSTTPANVHNSICSIKVDCSIFLPHPHSKTGTSIPGAMIPHCTRLAVPCSPTPSASPSPPPSPLPTSPCPGEDNTSSSPSFPPLYLCLPSSPSSSSSSPSSSSSSSSSPSSSSTRSRRWCNVVNSRMLTSSPSEQGYTKRWKL